jgi:hypothetical protein
MTTFAINPGSGPVQEASLEHAQENIKVFAKDITKVHHFTVKDIFRLEDDDDRGYFAYALDVEKYGLERRLRVDMPGLPLERVRYLGLPGQDAWEFQRLDLDHSSWLWKYAVDLSRAERDEDQSIIVRCPERIPIYDASYRCERDGDHKGKCQAMVVVAGYTAKELGPNIWTFVKWTASRRILT